MRNLTRTRVHMDCLLAIEALGIYQDVFEQDLPALQAGGAENPPLRSVSDQHPIEMAGFSCVAFSADKSGPLTSSAFDSTAKLIAKALGLET